MLNFFKKLFSKTKKEELFPKIVPSFRLEGLEYETESNSLYIDAYIIGKKLINTASIYLWKDNTTIASTDKEEIFKNTLEYLTRKGKKQVTILINIDFDKEFWESICLKYIGKIKSIEYTSMK